MKLVIRTVDGANVAGGRALVLCDDTGAMLPGQNDLELSQESDGKIMVSVSFAVDGVNVVMDGTPIEDED